jgi:hypothetical protein
MGESDSLLAHKEINRRSYERRSNIINSLQYPSFDHWINPRYEYLGGAMCSCKEPQLGFIDGDLENIYCALCELVIGKWSDLIIKPKRQKIEVSYED